VNAMNEFLADVQKVTKVEGFETITAGYDRNIDPEGWLALCESKDTGLEAL